MVTQGGILSDKKGLNLRGGGLSADALTEKDKKDIVTAAKAKADYGDIWSQASYRYPILWVAFLDPSDSYFLFADLVGFYTH